MVVPQVDAVVGAVVRRRPLVADLLVVLRAAVRVGAGDVRRRVLVAQRRARRARGVAVVQPEVESVNSQGGENFLSMK